MEEECVRYRLVLPAPEEGESVFNLYSDLDRFRREAFIRIPGVVNITDNRFESLLSGAHPLPVPDRSAEEH